MGVTAAQWKKWGPKCAVTRRGLTHRLQTGWTLEDALRTPAKADAGNTRDQICHILRTKPHQTTAELKAITGRTDFAVEHALKRCVMAGTLVKHHQGKRVTYTLAAGADEGHAVRPWVHPVRARAQGLPVAPAVYAAPAPTPESLIAPDYSNPLRGIAR